MSLINFNLVKEFFTNNQIKYKDKEKDLFRQLTFKYGPEQKLTNADKTAIYNRNSQVKKQSDSKPFEVLDVNEWMNNMLTQTDWEIINEIEKCNGEKIPQYLLDKI